MCVLLFVVSFCWTFDTCWRLLSRVICCLVLILARWLMLVVRFVLCVVLLFDVSGVLLCVA